MRFQRPRGVERILPDQDLLEAGHDRVGAGCFDDGLDDSRGGIDLADAGDAFIGVNQDDGGVLGAVRFELDAGDL